VPVRLFAFTCGWLEGSLDLFLAGEQGRIRVPVPSYLIEHPRGRAVFDSGLHPHTQTSPGERLGFLAEIFHVDYAPGEELEARLASVQADPQRIDFLVNSHLHFDHAGGNAQIPNARWVLQKREWDTARDPERAAASGFDAADWDLGHDVLAVDGEYDLFGDGSVVCLPTWGHTPGHQSLRVRLESGDVLLSGDACYLRRSLDELLLPRLVYDADEMRASMRRLRDLRARGARIFFGHDPDFWAAVPQATAIE